MLLERDDPDCQETTDAWAAIEPQDLRANTGNFSLPLMTGQFRLPADASAHSR
jgi:hypothetical protein